MQAIDTELNIGTHILQNGNAVKYLIRDDKKELIMALNYFGHKFINLDHAMPSSDYDGIIVYNTLLKSNFYIKNQWIIELPKRKTIFGNNNGSILILEIGAQYTQIIGQTKRRVSYIVNKLFEDNQITESELNAIKKQLD